MLSKFRSNLIRVKRLFKTNNDAGTFPDSGEKNDKSFETEHERIYRRFKEIIGLSDTNEATLIESINGHISAYSSAYNNHGYFHGKKGTRDYNIKKTAEAQATQITEHVNSILRGRKEANEFAIKEKKERLDVLANNSTQNMHELKEKASLRNNDFKQFDALLAYIYIFFGVTMILADVAVSINLVGFFGIGHIPENATFKDKIHDPELLLFSLGIAFCTVYVKILYDEYINSKLGLMQEEIKQAASRDIGTTALKIEVSIKLIVKLVILGGLLYLLYYLASYRAYFSIHSGMIEIPQGQSDAEYSTIKVVMLNCFLGISVIIPVISGIALSMGLKILAQRNTLSYARKQQRFMETQINEKAEEIKELTFRVTQFGFHLQEWSKITHKVEVISSLFVQHYNQGFRTGYRENFDNDMYIIVEEYRNEYINKVMSKHIQ